MSSNIVDQLKQRLPSSVERTIRRGVSRARRLGQTPTSGGTGSARSREAAADASADRIDELEALLARERQRARRAERRMNVARQEAGEIREQLVALTNERTTDADDTATRNGDLPPSFRYKLGEQRRRAQILREEHGLLEPVQEADAKLAGREFAARAGVRVPALIAGPVPIADLDLDALPDHFVLKPVGGHSSRGVFLMHRVAADRYESLLDQNEAFGRADLLHRYDQWLSKGSIPETVIVEQFVYDGPAERPVAPIDWRFFCFYGEVGFVMARNGNGYRAGSRVRFRFFDDRWDDLGVVRLDVRHDSEIAAPRQADAMMAAAQRLSASIPRPMVRIDLYDSDDGVYFGEVTPFPGGNFTMSEQYDRRFGEQWERAEARLERDAIVAGVRRLGE